MNLPFELYDPYPDYNSKAWKKKWHGTHFSCKGPRGVDVNGNADDTLGAYKLPADGIAFLMSALNDLLTIYPSFDTCPNIWILQGDWPRFWLLL